MWNISPHFRHPSINQTSVSCDMFSRGLTGWLGHWSTSLERKGWGSSSYSAWRRLKWNLKASVNSYTYPVPRRCCGARSFTALYGVRIRESDIMGRGGRISAMKVFKIQQDQDLNTLEYNSVFNCFKQQVALENLQGVIIRLQQFSWWYWFGLDFFQVTHAPELWQPLLIVIFFLTWCWLLLH